MTLLLELFLWDLPPNSPIHFFSTKAIASSLLAKSITMFDRGSPVEAQPMRLFSHLSLVSNSIFHLLTPAVPDCIAFLAGLNIRTYRSLMCSSGTPETAVISVAPSTTIKPFRAASWANSAEVFPASSNGIIFGSLTCTVFEVPSSHNLDDVDKAATLILLLIAIEDLAKAFP